MCSRYYSQKTIRIKTVSSPCNVPNQRCSLHNDKEQCQANALVLDRSVEREKHGRNVDDARDPTRRRHHVGELTLRTDEKQRAAAQCQIANRVELGEFRRPQNEYAHSLTHVAWAACTKRSARREARYHHSRSPECHKKCQEECTQHNILRADVARRMD